MIRPPIRKGFLAITAFVVAAGTLGLVLGADRLFAYALRTWGPYAFLGQPVDFADSELAVLAGDAEVRELLVGTPEQPMLEVGRAALELSLPALLAGRLRVEDASLERTVLHLVVKEDGTLAFDPGPPPPEVQEADPLPPPEKPLPKQENRDLVQIVTEFWRRYQHYRPYYERLGGLFGGGDDEEEAGPAPLRFPGKPEYVAVAQAVAEGEPSGGFFVDHAGVVEFSWQTLDERTGEPILPALESFSMQVDRVGWAPDDVTAPAEWSGRALLGVGGELSFLLVQPRDGSPNTLQVEAVSLPIDEIADLAKWSFPYRIQGGEFDVTMDELRFADDLLEGEIQVELRNARLMPRRVSPPVLGVEPKEFCRLLNSALQRSPVRFVIRLGGTPSAPTFSVENDTDLADLLGGAVADEVRRRADAFVEEKKGELQERLQEELQDRLGDEAADLLGGQAEEALGNLLGGKKGPKRKR